MLSTLSSFSFFFLHSSHSLTMRPQRIQVSSSRWLRLEEAEELETNEEPLFLREPFMERIDLESASSSLREGGGRARGAPTGAQRPPEEQRLPQSHPKEGTAPTKPPSRGRRVPKAPQRGRCSPKVALKEEGFPHDATNEEMLPQETSRRDVSPPKGRRPFLKITLRKEFPPPKHLNVIPPPPNPLEGRGDFSQPAPKEGIFSLNHPKVGDAPPKRLSKKRHRPQTTAKGETPPTGALKEGGFPHSSEEEGFPPCGRDFPCKKQKYSPPNHPKIRDAAPRATLQEKILLQIPQKRRYCPKPPQKRRSSSRIALTEETFPPNTSGEEKSPRKP